MRPKGKMIALLAIFAAIGLVTATGAFTTVQAERTVSVNVAGDSAALLQLDPASGQDYASLDSNGELAIDFDGSDTTFGNGAEGVNPNATTVVVDLFTVTNQGSSTVSLDYSKSGGTSGEQDSVFLINSSNSNANSQETFNGVTLSSGGSHDLGIVLDTTDANGAQLGNSSSFSVTFTLNATST